MCRGLTGRRPLQRVQLLAQRRVEEGAVAEVGLRGGRQVGHELQEGGPRGGPVRPAGAHQLVQPVGAVLRPLHHAALHHVPHHLLVRQPLWDSQHRAT